MPHAARAACARLGWGDQTPEVAIDSNPAERALRGPVVGRKNGYGPGALWSGALAVALFSLYGMFRLWHIACGSG